MRISALFFAGPVLALSQLGAAATPPDAAAKPIELPPLIVTGIQAFRDTGPDKAMELWLKDSPIDGSDTVQKQYEMLHRAQNLYGKYRGFESISSRDVSRRSRIVYAALNYDSGPLFAKFVLYRTELGWVVTDILFDLRENLITDAVLAP